MRQANELPMIKYMYLLSEITPPYLGASHVPSACHNATGVIATGIWGVACYVPPVPRDA